MVTLNYYINTYSFLVIIAGVVIFAIANNDYVPILFFGAFLAIAGTIQFFITKSVGQNLLNNVLSEDITNPDY